MPTTINPHPIAENFNDASYSFLTSLEAFVPRVYSDPDGIPTLGVGYALIEETTDPLVPFRTRGASVGQPGDFTALNAELSSIGVTLSPADQTLLRDVLRHLTEGDPAAAKQKIPMFQAGENSATQNRFSFGLISDGQSRTLFDNILPGYQDIVESRLVGAGPLKRLE